VAVARAAGILIDWTDFAELSAVVPLLARVYPNGSADVNQFQAAGGPGFVLRELLAGGLMHADVATVAPAAWRPTPSVPRWTADGPALARAARAQPGDRSVRRAARPFSPPAASSCCRGNLGRAVIKTSAVPDDRHVVEAPARVFDSQEALLAAFKAGELDRDVVVVVRFQGPQANGMPELHKLTPPLAVLQGKGFKRVALVTDGRMSGASRARCRRPSTSAPRRWPAARWPGCATATSSAWTPWPARSTCWSTTAPGRALTGAAP
jgi:phosphogluconate dehydratase